MTKSHYTAWLSFIMMESVFDCPLERDPLGWGLHQALGRCPTWYRGSLLQAVSGAPTSSCVVEVGWAMSTVEP